MRKQKAESRKPFNREIHEICESLAARELKERRDANLISDL